MNENKLIRIVLLILFLWLFFVYVIFFNIKKQREVVTETTSNTAIVVDNPINKFTWNSVQDNIQDNQKTKKNNWLIVDVLSWITDKITNGSWLLNTIVKNKDNIQSWEDLIPLPWFVDNTSNQWIIETNQSELPNLSGTEPFFGEIEVTKTLWLEYKYILKDNNWIYFVYMWTWTYDYEKNAWLLGWDVFYLRTELDLLKNDLPWDLAMFINIPNITYIKTPKFKRQLVFIVIYFNKEQRVLQIPYEIYYKKKKYIKKLFDQIY